MRPGVSCIAAMQELKEDIPVLKQYASHVANILMDKSYHYEDPKGLRTFLKPHINSDMRITDIMGSLLTSGATGPQSLNYKSVLKMLIQRNIPDNYNLEMEAYEDYDSSSAELIGEGESVMGGLKFEIRDTNLLK